MADKVEGESGQKWRLEHEDKLPTYVRFQEFNVITNRLIMEASNGKRYYIQAEEVEDE